MKIFKQKIKIIKIYWMTNGNIFQNVVWRLSFWFTYVVKVVQLFLTRKYKCMIWWLIRAKLKKLCPSKGIFEFISYDRFNMADYTIWVWPAWDNPTLSMTHNNTKVLNLEMLLNLVLNSLVSMDRSPSPCSLRLHWLGHIPSLASPACFHLSRFSLNATRKFKSRKS